MMMGLPLLHFSLVRDSEACSTFYHSSLGMSAHFHQLLLAPDEIILIEFKPLSPEYF